MGIETPSVRYVHNNKKPKLPVDATGAHVIPNSICWLGGKTTLTSIATTATSSAKALFSTFPRGNLILVSSSQDVFITFGNSSVSAPLIATLAAGNPNEEGMRIIANKDYIISVRPSDTHFSATNLTGSTATIYVTELGTDHTVS